MVSRWTLYSGTSLPSNTEVPISEEVEVSSRPAVLSWRSITPSCTYCWFHRTSGANICCAGHTPVHLPAIVSWQCGGTHRDPNKLVHTRGIVPSTVNFMGRHHSRWNPGLLWTSHPHGSGLNVIHWKTRSHFHYTPIAGRISRNQFKGLPRWLHFMENSNLMKRGEAGYNRPGKVRPVVDMLRTSMLRAYDVSRTWCSTKPWSPSKVGHVQSNTCP